ncbi:S-layer homology domain-containing protein [Aminipila sp.]|uniref:S-layer homology domain-containing protein n=1 Tax=Aminipila sp. TaxID=2060095 RepID=UPI00289AB83A|nr:S-layer homology domain-containing protein [Aminipila sp.]
MKKLVSMILMGTLIISTAAAAYAGSSSRVADKTIYTDLKSTNWAYEAVNTMSQKAIVKGYNDGSFKPANVVTYGEFIKMALVAATGEDVGNSTKGNWATNYYNKALELKYFGSTDIKAEQLNNQIPRSDMTLIVSSILGEKKIDNYDELESNLKDINSTVKHDYDIIKAYASGIITGYEDNTFRPENTLTRAESATVIYRLVDESKRVLPKGKIEEIKDTSGTDIASVIKNYRTFEGISEAEARGSDFMEATSYEFVTDMSAYKVTLRENMGTKWIEINGQTPLKLEWGNMYLMKDNNLIMFTQDGIYDDEYRMKEHLDITTIEYFVFPNYKSEEVPYVEGVGRISHKIGILPNPLYKGK